MIQCILRETGLKTKLRIMLHKIAIAPQFLQLIKAPERTVKNVHYHIHIIEQHPFLVFHSFNVPGFFFLLLQHLFFHIACNGSHLRGRFCVADDKEVAYGIIDFAQINGADVFSFFILNGGNDHFNSRRNRLLFGGLLFPYFAGFDRLLGFLQK